MVYRKTLIPATPEGIKVAVRTLAHPPLARVSKQLRADSLPIFYGENEFAIHIGCLPGRSPLSREDRRECRREVDAAYERFIAMFEAFSASGSGTPGTSYISHIKHIFITYDQHYLRSLDTEHTSSLFNSVYVQLAVAEISSIGFLMGAPQLALGKPCDRVRICQSIVNWDDFTAVWDALLGEMDAWASDGDTLSQVVPGDRLAEILWFCAKECPLAARHVELWCDMLWDCRRVASKT